MLNCVFSFAFVWDTHGGCGGWLSCIAPLNVCMSEVFCILCIPLCIWLCLYDWRIARLLKYTFLPTLVVIWYHDRLFSNGLLWILFEFCTIYSHVFFFSSFVPHWLNNALLLQSKLRYSSVILHLNELRLTLTLFLVSRLQLVGLSLSSTWSRNLAMQGFHNTHKRSCTVAPPEKLWFLFVCLSTL